MRARVCESKTSKEAGLSRSNAKAKVELFERGRVGFNSQGAGPKNPVSFFHQKLSYMKIKLKNTIEAVREIEITVPHYFKNGFYFYAFLTEDFHGLEIFRGPCDGLIITNCLGPSTFQIALNGSEEITEEEFKAEFDAAIIKLQSKLSPASEEIESGKEVSTAETTK